MFFAISPKKALLSDLNSELINAYNVVIENPIRLLNEIRKIPVNNKTYYIIRSNNPRSDIQKAVRFIYLNRTCYGGLYRENQQGIFNTPYGGGSRTPAPLWEHNLITNANKSLKKKSIKLRVQDFEESIKIAKRGDVIYCDPTYRSVTRNQFDRYGSNIFSWKDQERLAKIAFLAANRGALVIISNTFCEEINTLYNGAIRILLNKKKSIGNKSNNPNNHNEYLIILDPEGKINEWKL